MKFDLKTYITRPIIGCFVIGFVVGSLLLGVIDANRPTPLFSRADPIASFPIECVGAAQQAENFYDWANSQPRPVRPDIYTAWEQEYQRITENVLSCVQAICEPIYNNYFEAANDLLDARIAVQEAEVALDRATNAAAQAEIANEAAQQAFDDALTTFMELFNSLTPPYTQSQQAQLDQLRAATEEASNAAIAAEAHFTELNNLAQDAQQAVTEAEDVQEQAQLVADQTHQVYVGQHCDSAMSVDYPPLDPNDPPDYNPPPYDPPAYGTEPSGYDQPPTNTPSPTPTPGRNPKDDATSSDGIIKSIVPKLQGSDKTRAY